MPTENKAGTSWIIQWKDEPDPGFAASSTIVRSYPDSRVTVAEPRAGESMEEWLGRWQHSAYVESVQPNQAYRIAASPNDPMISNQKYLEQIHAREAWDVATGNEAITIALVDTGVDLTHPDLVSHLVKGTNLINPGQPPADDNGHGTNVAGVIAASANNDKGIAGLLWKAKIMPVKALESNGTGEEDKLGEGIRYAVDHGAKIVVLSLGLNKASAYMESIVKYAESRGVLLVAASGNEGNSVKYPAAYPTVLAVGGASADNHAATLSNYGPELDVVAPWNVFTTAVGGRYIYTGGTSLAAPQVAAVSALAWSLYPEMKPYEIRNLIRQTAEDLETPGWDAKTGYGLLRADRALSEPYRADMYEPNNKIGEAKPTSVEKRIDAVLDGKTDEDWFVMEAPYDGTLLIQLATETKAKVEVTHYRSVKSGGTVLRGDAEEGLSVPVTKGKNYIKLAAPELQEPAAYHMTTRFRIYRDPFEDNDRQYKAYTLPARTGMITGTFHQQNDQDWFVLNVERAGTLQLKVTVDTARIDPTLSIQKKGRGKPSLTRPGTERRNRFFPRRSDPERITSGSATLPAIRHR
ncbi:S8 family serine peptidase [Paenibacillus sp. CC-CFT747]|nr:S8 family serine peptidase [Paenibacillus sp. CC-CFT747]